MTVSLIARIWVNLWTFFPKTTRLQLSQSLWTLVLCYFYHGKFHPRAYKCLFLGHPHNIKGYKVLDLNILKTFISRNVIFYESIFPSIPNITHTPFIFPEFSPIFDTSSFCFLVNFSNFCFFVNSSNFWTCQSQKIWTTKQPPSYFKNSIEMLYLV